MTLRNKGILFICMLLLCVLSAGSALAAASTWVLVDNEQVKIVASDYTYNPKRDLGCKLYFRFENKTDVALVFSIEEVLINEKDFDLGTAKVVNPHSSESADCWFLLDDPAYKIDFSFGAWDMDNPDPSVIVEDSYSIYPYGEEAFDQYKAEHAAEYENNPQATPKLSEEDAVLTDNEQVRIVLPASNHLEYDAATGTYSLSISVENKTDSEIGCLGFPSTINGYTIPMTTALDSLSAGETKDVAIVLSPEIVKSLGIDSIQQASTRLFVCSEAHTAALGSIWTGVLSYSQSLSPEDPDILIQLDALGNEINAQFDQLDTIFDSEIILIE